MPYQNSSRLHTLRAMRKGECPGWTLLWSEDADMDWSKFDALRKFIVPTAFLYVLTHVLLIYYLQVSKDGVLVFHPPKVMLSFC
jgi:hypothetical protein